MATINFLRRFQRRGQADRRVETTHEGAIASRITSAERLRRLVMSCLLWEDGFYVDGVAIAEQIRDVVRDVDPAVAAAIAIEAREQQKLRHVPLWIAREMARLEPHKAQVGTLLQRIVQRPDEITEFVALYWKDGRQPLSAQVKKGLAACFARFDEYQLAKYDRDGDVRLRDVLFMVHAAPGDRAAAGRYTRTERALGLRPPTEGAALLQRLAERALETPDTWETNLSAGADKRATFERLIAERKLGALALLRNLRGMKEAGVPKSIVRDGLMAMRTDRVLPFRFIAAARHVPEWEDIIEPTMLAMLAMLTNAARLDGRTAVLIDVSGSMDAAVSAKSDLRRLDAACALAVLVREIAADITVASFSNDLKIVPARRGFALRDSIVNSQPHGGTYLGLAVEQFAARASFDRLIVITDEQTADDVLMPPGRNYMINVASNRNGIAYNRSVHIDGWSEAVIDFIQRHEALEKR